MPRTVSRSLNGTNKKGTPHETTSSGRFVSVRASVLSESISAIALASSKCEPKVGRGWVISMNAGYPFSHSRLTAIVPTSLLQLEPIYPLGALNQAIHREHK